MLYNKFLTIAEQYPHNTALSYQEHTWSYSQSIKEINFLSTILNHSKKSSILIFCDKNPYIIFFQLACNKSQHIFMHLDIATPFNRVLNNMEEHNPYWVFNNTDIDFSLYGYDLIYSISYGKLWQLKTYKPNNYPLKTTHIYFSSGSTGVPKSILLNDEALVSVVMQQAKIFNIDSQSRFAWLLSPAFDASLSDIYTTILSGGCLYICDFPMTKIKTLIDFFNEYQITHTDLSPTILNLIKPHSLPFLKNIVFGGEIAKTDTIMTWFNAGKNMFNAYGPTETTICSSVKMVNDFWQSNNIGIPLIGVNYALSENFPNLFSHSGELIISGNHICLGYTNNFLNDKKFFIYNNIIYYKTGDLVKKTLNNEYLFLGRIDRQFKYHGVLICPEEIEYQALQASCLEAVCKLEEKITLYYSGPLDSKQLQIFLSEHLPSNMLPQKLVKMTNLIKNTNGKIQL
jgi:acyl-coenzyme A synthetase/AMP-(fatty) acid ligase